MQLHEQKQSAFVVYGGSGRQSPKAGRMITNSASSILGHIKSQCSINEAILFDTATHTLHIKFRAFIDFYNIWVQSATNKDM